MTSDKIILSPVAKRYALALVDLAAEGKVLSKVEKDLEALSKLIGSSADFRTFVNSPTSSKDQQLAVLEALAKKAKLLKVTLNFLGVVVQNGRLAELPAFIQAAKEELSARRGELSVGVQSAIALTAAQQKALKAEISKATGKDIILNAKIDTDLIGGMVLTVGSHRIDASVSGRLDRLKEVMSAQVDLHTNDNTENLSKKEA